MSNTLLASYKPPVYEWNLRFNPQLNTKHANTIGVPFVPESFSSSSMPMKIDWGDGTTAIVNANSQFEDFTHTYDADVSDVTVTMSSHDWLDYRYACSRYSESSTPPTQDEAASHRMRYEYFNETLVAVVDAIPNNIGDIFYAGNATFHFYLTIVVI